MLLLLPTLHQRSLNPWPLSKHGTREDVLHVLLGVFEVLMWTHVAYNLYTLNKCKPWWSSHFGGLDNALYTTIFCLIVGLALDGPKGICIVGCPLAPHLDPLPYWAIMLL
jgi:hypothetical protein